MGPQLVFPKSALSLIVSGIEIKPLEYSLDKNIKNFSKRLHVDLYLKSIFRLERIPEKNISTDPNKVNKNYT